MKNPFIGPWRIVWMSDWDQDYVDMDVPGHFTFGPGGSGNFQFGMVQGQMDFRTDRRQDQRVDFTWHGFDEGDELTGRGYAEIVDGELRGHIYFHLGDDSAFRAVKRQLSARKPKTAS
jgi:hypothetical protein